MKNVYTAVIKRDGDWWIGWIEEIPGVNSQGATREELVENLKSALLEMLEMNRADAREAAAEGFEEIRDLCVKRGDFIANLTAQGSGSGDVFDGGHGKVEAAVQIGYMGSATAFLSLDQLVKFRALVERAKAKLDSIQEIE